MFELFKETNLILDNEAGFRAVDSCITQLLCIGYETYLSSDDNLEGRAIFWTCLKHLTRCDIKVMYKNSSKLKFQVTS